MLHKIAKMPITVIICLLWVVIWAFIAHNKAVLPTLCGKGLKQIGSEHYRFFTVGLCHTNILHLLVNVFAMLWIGYLYENHIGSIRFLLIGVICATASQVIFLAMYSNTTQSFGGSGYGFALCGFGLTMQFLVPDFPKIALGTWSGNWLTLYLILSNIPLLSFVNVTTVVFHIIAFALGIGAALLTRALGIEI